MVTKTGKTFLNFIIGILPNISNTKIFKICVFIKNKSQWSQWNWRLYYKIISQHDISNVALSHIPPVD